MANLKTTYLGLELNNPLIVGASSLTANPEKLSALENAGAIVIKSLFEEQIQLERFEFDETLHREEARSAEMITVVPQIQHGGPKNISSGSKKPKKPSVFP